MGEPTQAQCPDCRGEGSHTVPRRVTRAMALDACEPSMEGMLIPDEYPCDRCHGTGVIVRDRPEQEDDDGE